jgi:type VI secretion system secreted protein Hcp
MNSAARLFVIIFLTLSGSIIRGQPAPHYEGYLWMEGLKGGSTEADHKDWIPIDQLAFGVEQSGEPVGSPRFSALQIIKPADRSTPHLFERCASGKPVPNAVLEWVHLVQDRHRFFRIELDNVTVASVSSQARLQADTPPTESVTLNYQRIGWTYTELSLEGDPRQEQIARWDLATEQGNAYAKDLLLTMDARRTPDGNVTLSWPTDPDQGYRILASESITGPFTEVMIVPDAEAGSGSHTVTVNGPVRFFILEKLAE